MAAWCLLASVLLDGCDGNLARKWSVSSPFGEQLDSLADMTAFGIAISFFSYGWILTKQPAAELWVGVVCSLVAITSAIRLARFNSSAYDDRYFQGVPTTAAACIITVTYLLIPGLNLFWALALIAGVSLLMISQFAYPKVKQLKVIPLIWLPLLLMMLFWNLSHTILLVAVLYLSSGPVLSWRLRHAPD